MKITITGDAYALTSAIKVSDIELLKKYNSAALRVTDKEGNTKFAVSYYEGKPSVAAHGVTFSGKSRGENEGCAAITGVIPSGLSTDAAKDFVAEMFGGVTAYIEQLEKDVPKAAEAVSAQRKKLVEGIAIA